MPFRSVKITTLTQASRESVFTLHHKAGGSPGTILIAELAFDFSDPNETQIQFDFTRNNVLKGGPWRSVFIDLQNSDSPIIVGQFQDVNYGAIALQGRSQGWFPVLWDQPLHILVQFKGGVQAPSIILRFATELIAGPVWRTQ
jgi:hypothetical protein